MLWATRHLAIWFVNLPTLLLVLVRCSPVTDVLASFFAMRRPFLTFRRWHPTPTARRRTRFTRWRTRRRPWVSNTRRARPVTPTARGLHTLIPAPTLTRTVVHLPPPI
jgi:hypothetical protein